MEVKIINNIKIPLKEHNGIYSIFSHERINIEPNTKKIITLPYFIVKDSNKYVNFVLNRQLALSGLQILWNNLNEDNSSKVLEFVLFNSNISREIIDGYSNNPLARIAGSNDRLDILSNGEFGKILI